ncbi:MAG: hypothetical protein HQM16_14215 [Deltaproteobacteria bacterium]|nr:hypothetical protein [Deltaproteobacteria bacterium]
MLYGYDNDNVFRLIQAQEGLATEFYTGTPETSGDEKQEYVVWMVVYAEGTSDAGSNAYLDLQQNGIGAYIGVDDTFGTADDSFFRCRTRITGMAVLDNNGSVVLGAGDFSWSSHDRSAPDESGKHYETPTQTAGRGSYGAGELSLFKMSHAQEFFASSEATEPYQTNETEGGNFCLRHGGLFPEYVDVTTDQADEADKAICSAYETGYAWGDSVFPFTITPELGETPDLGATFENIATFEGNDTDMISASGYNF